MAKGLDYDNDVIHQQDGTRWIIFRWTKEQLVNQSVKKKNYPDSQTIFHILIYIFQMLKPLKISLIWLIFNMSETAHQNNMAFIESSMSSLRSNFSQHTLVTWIFWPFGFICVSQLKLIPYKWITNVSIQDARVQETAGGCSSVAEAQNEWSIR